jgi:hypothetical protein
MIGRWLAGVLSALLVVGPGAPAVAAPSGADLAVHVDGDTAVVGGRGTSLDVVFHLANRGPDPTDTYTWKWEIKAPGGLTIYHKSDGWPYQGCAWVTKPTDIVCPDTDPGIYASGYDYYWHVAFNIVGPYTTPGFFVVRCRQKTCNDPHTSNNWTAIDLSRTPILAKAPKPTPKPPPAKPSPMRVAPTTPSPRTATPTPSQSATPAPSDPTPAPDVPPAQATVTATEPIPATGIWISAVVAAMLLAGAGLWWRTRAAHRRP